MFVKYGIPEDVFSDQGSQFMDALMEKVMDVLGVQQLCTSPTNKWVCGQTQAAPADYGTRA